MLESNFKAINDDLRALVKDAQSLFVAASELSGEKADELRNRGMALLDSALVEANGAKDNALVAGKKMADSAEGYLKENPWRSIGAAAGVGVLAGMIFNHKKSDAPANGSDKSK